ncbi:MAG TPA: hypothetical protein PKZ27_03175 [Rhodocyclaceae bacterium]|nr:hypothetical protein [Rhodocyclaceae bacterium]
MKRRSLLAAALFAPMAPRLAALAALPAEPARVLALGERALELRKVTDFAALQSDALQARIWSCVSAAKAQDQMRVWSTAFWEDARRRTFLHDLDTTKTEDI